MGQSNDSTQASSFPTAPNSDTNRDRPAIYRNILKDELKLFDNEEIDQILEQAQMKQYPQVLAR